MAFQVNVTESLALEECVNCGCTFAVTSRFQSQRQQDKKTFYCPNGHPQSYTKSTAETLREQLDQKSLKITQLNDSLASKSKYIEALTGEIEKLEKKLERRNKKEAKAGATSK